MGLCLCIILGCGWCLQQTGCPLRATLVLRLHAAFAVTGRFDGVEHSLLIQDGLCRRLQRAKYSYHRMDGSTPIGMRARLVDDFNNKDTVFVFLLTTKVGGLGINLTGANRWACTAISAVLVVLLTVEVVSPSLMGSQYAGGQPAAQGRARAHSLNFATSGLPVAGATCSGTLCSGLTCAAA